MLSWVCYAMVFLGAGLMVYNIYGFISFTRSIRGENNWQSESTILYAPTILLVMFLIGYLIVGFFGNPDIVIAGILFFGSVFVYIMYRYLRHISNHIETSKQLEAELRVAEESSRAKSSFLASMSHEMRTPLNVIIGMDNLELKRRDLSAESRDRLQKIDLSAQHLLGLIDNMLDLNRIDSGELVIENSEFALAGMLERVNAIAGQLFSEKGLTYETDVPKVNPRLFGDELQIQRVLLSILENAAKYTDAPGTVHFAVECPPAPINSTGVNARTLRFTIVDTGEGIDESFLPHIFEPFAQEDSSSTSQHGGTGMSLAVAKNLMDLMGGTIQAESQKGKGATFVVTISLPQVGEDNAAESTHPESAAPSPAELESQPGSSEGLLANTRILIVEDMPENAELVADLLELEGAESEHAENGQVAVNMMAEVPDGYFDAILMDLRMPVMDGLEAARHIRAMDREYTKTVPIVALTANAFEEDVRQSKEANMDAHLPKPTDADMLYATLQQLTGGEVVA